jgi:2',3'-cyclic-nucleotide 2'-phosphodiesterase (5'-nucleotidase family)
MRNKNLVMIILLVLITSCLSITVKEGNTSRVVKIAIMATNDLHGAAFPK